MCKSCPVVDWAAPLPTVSSFGGGRKRASTAAMADHVIWYDRYDREHKALVGGKNASLGEMTLAGLPVPPGFAVTTTAYQRIWEDPELGAGVNELLAKIDHAAHGADRKIAGEIPRPHRVGARPRRRRRRHQCGLRRPVRPLRGRRRAGRRALVGHRRGPARRLLRRPAGHLPVGAASSRCPPTSAAAGPRSTPTAPSSTAHNGVPTPHDLDGGRRAEDGQLRGLRRGDHAEPDQRRPLEDHHRRLMGARRGGRLGAGHPGQHPRRQGLARRSVAEISPKTPRLPDAGGSASRSRGAGASRAAACVTDDELLAVAALAKRAEKHYGCPQDVEWAIDADLPEGEQPDAAAVPAGDGPLLATRRRPTGGGPGLATLHAPLPSPRLGS